MLVCNMKDRRNRGVKEKYRSTKKINKERRKEKEKKEIKKDKPHQIGKITFESQNLTIHKNYSPSEDL